MGIVRRVIGLLARVLVVLVVVGIVAVGVLVATKPRPQDRPGWTRLPSLPRSRGEVASAALVEGTGEPGRLVVAGGLSGLASTSDAVDVFDLSALSWSEGPPLPEARHHAAAAVLGPHVHLTGGAASVRDWTPRSEVWRLEVGGGWSTVAPMPEGRQGHAMVEAGGALYVLGGVGDTSRTLIFRERGGWTAGAPLLVARDHLRAASFQSEIWVLGGRAGRPTTRVDIYDPAADTFREGPPLPEPMSAMSVGVLRDGLHAIGGEDPRAFGGGVTRAHYVIADARSRWRRAPEPILAVHGAAHGVIGDRLLVAGGASRQGAFSVLSWTGLLQSFEGQSTADEGPA